MEKLIRRIYLVRRGLRKMGWWKNLGITIDEGASLEEEFTVEEEIASWNRQGNVAGSNQSRLVLPKSKEKRKPPS